ALDLQCAVGRSKLGSDHDGLAAIQVWQHARRGVHGAAYKSRREAGHDRTLQLLDQLAHAVLHLIDRTDMREGAAAYLGGSSHEETVRRRTDADHEDPRAAPLRRDGVEQLLLVADLAVGEEHHL